MTDLKINQAERKILRELARKQREMAALPVMQEREESWYRHNDLQGELPMIHFETWTCEAELLPPFQCRSEAGRAIELQLRRAVLNHERIEDDRVVPAFFEIPWQITFRLFNLPTVQKHAVDAEGRELTAFEYVHHLKDLKEDLPTLQPTFRQVDRQGTLAWKAFVEDLLGDILPVRMLPPYVGACLSQDVVRLLGMEAMLFAMKDCSAEFHALMRKITQAYLDYHHWLEEQGLLQPNNEDYFLGQGTFGFTKDLPQSGYVAGQAARLADMWGYMDSQETVGISPGMFHEFFFPYYLEIAWLLGLLNYGCCEPVHAYWEKSISKLPNLRKVSISPWCDEEAMGQALQGTRVIYHRKPSPLFIGVGKELDEAAFRKHILKTLRCARGCKLEFSFRDVYTLSGNTEKPRRAVQIVRELINEHWK